jgi:hypothetical protein
VGKFKDKILIALKEKRREEVAWKAENPARINVEHYFNPCC